MFEKYDQNFKAFFFPQTNAGFTFGIPVLLPKVHPST